MEGLRGPSHGMTKLGRLAGLVEPSSSSACFNHRWGRKIKPFSLTGFQNFIGLP